MDRLSKFAARAASIHKTIAQSDPALAAGDVWCKSCGATRKVDSAHCLRHGWPECCGQTMYLGGPPKR